MRGLRRKLIGLPAGVKAVHHYWPDAYCVAKTAPHCAVFAIPPIKTIPEQGRYDLIQNASVEGVKLGEWVSLAYCEFPDRGLWTVALPHQPSLQFRAKQERKGARKRNQPADAQTLAHHGVKWK